MAFIEGFRGRMAKRVGSAGTSIVLAIDLLQKEDETPQELKNRALAMLKDTAASICAVKVNAQLLLPLGLRRGIEDIVSEAHKLGLQAIMDAKINDVGHTNAYMARMFFDAGFDAVITNPLVGWEEGVQSVFEEASQHHAGVILLAYLSHKAAGDGYGLQVVTETKEVQPIYQVFLERALRWNAEGVIVGATHLDKIREAAFILKGRIPIYSPGVGAQGGSLEATMNAGATYPIIGRAITEAVNPKQAALGFRESLAKTRGTLQA